MKKINFNFLLRGFVLCLSVFFLNAGFAQRQRNYVYIFDCTESMERDNHIWQPAKDFLKKDLQQLDENAKVTVVLFHQDTPTPIQFKAKDLDWKDLDSKCDDLIKNSKFTGICNAWDKGLKYIDPNRNNYFYLFTDGKENVIKPNGTAAVCQRIKEWCNRTSSNDYAFFVALPSKSLLDSPEIKQIQNATKYCDRTYYISGRIAPFGSFDRTSFNQNSHSPKNIEVGFSDCGTFNAKTSCDNPYYKISLKGGKVKDGKATFEVKQLKQPESNTQVHFKVIADEKDMHICNPDMFINIDTRKLRNVDFAQPSGSEGEYDAGKAETYSKFLIFSGKEYERVTIDLGAKFNEQAKIKNCNMKMHVVLPQGCKAYYNGMPISNDFELAATDNLSELSIEVPHQLEEKDFYADLTGTSLNLETINSEPGRQYKSKIHFVHNKCWHPVKTFLFWLFIILMSSMAAWFIFLKWIIYPRIRLARIEFKCESKKYYESKRINSARKVVVGPTKGKQSWINKCFTGKIVYISNKDVWPYQWELTPKGTKKSGRINLHGKYVVNPITSEFKILQEYTITNKENKDKITVKL